MVPFSPTATNRVPDQAIPYRVSVPVETRCHVQVAPSGEVIIVEAVVFNMYVDPTATNCDPDHATSCRA
jgi:hypothetical protein